MRTTKFINKGIYHIYNRGVEKRTIFLDGRDYMRFVHDLYEFNDTEGAPPSNVRFQTKKPATAVLEAELPKKEVRLPNKQILVEILAFCIMPNHFHMLIRQKENNGIARFMQKTGTGYTNYFNTKYKHSGHVFQGKYKDEEVSREAHLLHLPTYIHLNPLDLKYPEWRKNNVQDENSVMDFLKNYRWSSFLDYTGQKNFPSVTQRKFLQQIIGDSKEYEKSTKKWLTERKITEEWRAISKFE